MNTLAKTGGPDADSATLPYGISREATVPRSYAWLVFGLTIGLLLSDYMSRQVINAVFPLLKGEWSLDDRQLGMLGGIVPLMVGIFTVPLSYLADRFGRVGSIVLMAAVWCVATLGSAMAHSFGEMMLARLAIGLGEAAYGSVGLAVVFSVFPSRLRSTLSGLYGAAAFMGSVLGLALGGKLAAVMGWRGAFDVIAGAGFVLVALFALFVREKRLGQAPEERRSTLAGMGRGDTLKALFRYRTILYTYIGSAAQLFITGSILVWMPTYVGRYYHLPTDKAALMAAAFIVLTGLGMGLLGNVADRLGQRHPSHRLLASTSYTIASFVLLMIAFRLPPGTAQVVVLGLGVFVVSGTWGPTTAVIANMTPVAIHSTALAMLTLLNNLIGLAPGPFVTGLLSDRYGLDFALQWIPLASIVSGLALYMAWRHHDADLERRNALCDLEASRATSTAPAAESDLVPTVRRYVEDGMGSGLYCAESVALALAKAQGMESDAVARMATAFCSGMSQTCGPCGALTGAVMGIGLALGRSKPGELVDGTYVATQSLVRAFEAEFGARNCSDLLGCDLATPQGRATFQLERLHHRCGQYTIRAAELAAAIIADAKSQALKARPMSG